MPGDTPDLDWIADDLYFDHLTAVLTLDALHPRGSPASDVCGCCASRRGERRRSHVSAGRSRVYRLCLRCDATGTRLRLPGGWSA